MAGAPADPIRVLVIDDSALIRQLLTKLLDQDPGIKVVGTAADPFQARDAIKQLRPDVLTLDVEMPRMDGLVFLRNLMRLNPLPVVMVSTLTEAGADVTLQALDLGAIDFVTKPRNDVRRGLEDYAEVLIQKVKTAAKAKVWARSNIQQIAARALPRLVHTTDSIIAIGASTGGTEAIKAVVMEFPADAPGTVVTQHIPGNFSQPFVDRLNRLATVTVKHASDGEAVVPGTVYFPPGEHHLRLMRSGAKYFCKLDDGPPVNRHRPSVDVLFHSVAEAAGKNAAAAILTGMGADGAQGLLAIREAGGTTIAQDEASSVVWGMPRVAVEIGAAQRVLPLKDVAYALLTALSNKEKR